MSHIIKKSEHDLYQSETHRLAHNHAGLSLLDILHPVTTTGAEARDLLYRAFLTSGIRYNIDSTVTRNPAADPKDYTLNLADALTILNQTSIDTVGRTLNYPINLGTLTYPIDGENHTAELTLIPTTRGGLQTSCHHRDQQR